MFRIARFTIVTLIACLAVISGCRSSQTNPHQLLIYTPHGQDMLRDFVGRYKQAHPEADVQLVHPRKSVASLVIFSFRKFTLSARLM